MRKRRRVLLFVIVLLIALTSCKGFNEKETQSVFQMGEIRDKKRSNYTIYCEIDSEMKTLSAIEKLKYYNNDHVTMEEIYLHVYPNAFKKKETAPFLFDDFDTAYKNGFEPGYADISSISKIGDNGKKLLKYSFHGEGETVLKIELDSPVKPYRTLDLELEFKLQIPPASERFGYWEDGFNFGNWYPIAAVYDDKNGWNIDKYYAIGDPFFSDLADYDVTIKAPRDYVIAASGSLIKKEKQGEAIIWRFAEKALRDFAFVANKHFEIIEKSQDGINVKSYYYEGDRERGKKALEYGIRALEVFNQLYGKYPYDQYSIVATQFPSGMEYPMLVYISDLYYKPTYSIEALEITIVHETAHQWFYGIIGNDQVKEAWLDEGFAAYSETLFAEKVYGKAEGKTYYEMNVESRVEDALSSETIDGRLSRPLSQYEGWHDYGPTAYSRGAQMLHELRSLLGDETFFNIIKTYVEEYKFKIATKDDFIRVCQETSKKDLSDFFKPWF